MLTFDAKNELVLLIQKRTTTSFHLTILVILPDMQYIHLIDPVFYNGIIQSSITSGPDNK